ncbi:thioredoxin family protein [Candidatus Azambacteria bacterium]|nr:thioredoxin family protein [Candidatus Azambacteria bacterium]
MNKIILEEIFSPGCHTCRELEVFWEGIKGDFSNVDFRRIDATSDQGQKLVQKYIIFSSPTIIINGELFATGGFDKKKLLEKLKSY